MLRNVAEIDLSTSVLGQKVSMPICVGATAMQCMAHVDGELATVRGRKKVLTQRDRNKLTFSDCLLGMHQANTSLDVFIVTIVKLIDWHRNACSWMSYLPQNRVFSTALGGNIEKFKYEMQKFLIRGNLSTSQSASNYGYLKGYVQ